LFQRIISGKLYSKISQDNLQPYLINVREGFAPFRFMGIKKSVIAGMDIGFGNGEGIKSRNGDCE
jgi:hypothetical protein